MSLTTMAQSVSNLSNTLTLAKPLSSTFNGRRRLNFINGVRAMKSDHRRDNYDQLQRSGLKKREPSSAPIGLWDRFPAARTVQQMLDTMDRIIEDPLTFNTTFQSPSPLPNNGVRTRTPWEIKELENEYKMRFDMPGMTKDDVKIWVEEKMLVIKAEKVSKSSKNGEENQNGGVENEGEEEEEELWGVGSYGRYNTRIGLPENVEFEKIKAQVKDGVLYVTIPKARSISKVFSINVN